MDDVGTYKYVFIFGQPTSAMHWIQGIGWLMTDVQARSSSCLTFGDHV